MKYTFLILVLFASCKTQEWAIKSQAIIHHKYPLLEAQNCANLFPTTYDTPASIVIRHTDTSYLPGETVFVECPDTAKEPGVITKTIKVPCNCPPNKIITNTDTVRQPVLVTNTAAIKAANIERDQYKGNATNNRTWAIVASIIAVLIGFMLFLSIRSKKKENE